MSKITDLIHNSKRVLAVEPETLSADGDLTGEIIDTQGFYAGLIVPCTSKTATLTVKSFKQSDNSDMSSPEDIPATNKVVGTGAINFVPTKRYVQIVLTAKKDDVAGATCILFGADVNGKINE